jgi:hypothetical protein
MAAFLRRTAAHALGGRLPCGRSPPCCGSPRGTPPGGRRRRWMIAAVAPALDEGHGDRQHAEQRQDPRGRMGHAVDGTGLAVHVGTHRAPAIPQEPGTRAVADYAGAQGPDAEARVVPDGADADGTVAQPSAHSLGELGRHHHPQFPADRERPFQRRGRPHARMVAADLEHCWLASVRVALQVPQHHGIVPVEAAAAPGRPGRPVVRAAWPGHLDGAPVVAKSDVERAVADRVTGQTDVPQADAPPCRARTGSAARQTPRIARPTARRATVA